jgi:Fe-S cluster assembly protein SufD
MVHIRLQMLDPRHIQFNRTDAVIAGGAEYIRLDIDNGGHYVRHELNLQLQGKNAMARSGGVLWAEGSTTLDTRLVCRHQAPDTTCNLLWRGLADGKARANFFGGIHIDAGADGSDATLSNKNLLLSAQAQINTQPALEIYADEVKAAHGATVGQLDAGALFYLRSRGVSEREAIALLTRAFYAEALAVLQDDALAARLEPYLPLCMRSEGTQI